MDRNPLCDGQQCRETDGGIRLLLVIKKDRPYSSCLCRSCFDAEMVWRRDRNIDLAPAYQMEIPKWENLGVFQPGRALVGAEGRW